MGWPGLAHYLTVEEVESGSVAMELFHELGGHGESDFLRFAAELDTVIEVTKVADERRRHEFAGVPQYQLRLDDDYAHDGTPWRRRTREWMRPT